MEAPKCRICGQRHWGIVCALEKSSRGEPEAANLRATKSQANAVVAPSPREPNPKFDRVAYQREYMRKRRAKAQNNLT
jgi:hypothetical protein